MRDTHMNQNAHIAYYESRYTPVPQRNTVWRYVSDYLTPLLNITDSSVVLELGTGRGSWIRTIPASNRHALDIHPHLPQIFADEGITDVHTHVGSCTDLSAFASNSCDVILMSNLLEHLTMEDGAICLQEIWRVLRPGGRLCVMQPNFSLCYREYFDDYTHRAVYSDVSLADCLTAHRFKVLRTWRRFLPFSMGGTGRYLSFLVPWYLRSPIKPFAGQMAIIALKSCEK